jgi:hypothetical protein
MSRLGTGQRSRIIVERLDQIRPTIGRDFALSCPHAERIVGEALPAKASDRERNLQSSAGSMFIAAPTMSWRD